MSMFLKLSTNNLSLPFTDSCKVVVVVIGAADVIGDCGTIYCTVAAVCSALDGWVLAELGETVEVVLVVEVVEVVLVLEVVEVVLVVGAAGLVGCNNYRE